MKHFPKGLGKGAGIVGRREKGQRNIWPESLVPYFTALVVLTAFASPHLAPGKEGKEAVCAQAPSPPLFPPSAQRNSNFPPPNQMASKLHNTLGTRLSCPLLLLHVRGYHISSTERRT